MTTRTHRRPATLWLAVALLLILAFLSAVGGFLFNLSGADDAGEVVVGLVFVALALVYAWSAIRLPSGSDRARKAAIAAAALHGTFNLVVKVGIEGETESVMFIVLAALVLALLVPARRGWPAPSPIARA